MVSIKLELHNVNEQHDDLATDNIMLHWELDKCMIIGGCGWKCTLHMGEKVESLWYVETKDAKEKMKKVKFWVALELFRVHKWRHHDLPKHYTEVVERLTVAQQHCNHADIMLNAREGHKSWTLFVDLLSKESLGSHIDLASTKRQMQMDRVRWDEPVDC